MITPVYSTPAPLSFFTGFEGGDSNEYGNDYSTHTTTTGGVNKAIILTYPAQSKSPSYKRKVKPGDAVTLAKVFGFRPTGSQRLGRLVVGEVGGRVV